MLFFQCLISLFVNSKQTSYFQNNLRTAVAYSMVCNIKPSITPGERSQTKARGFRMAHTALRLAQCPELLRRNRPLFIPARQRRAHPSHLKESMGAVFPSFSSGFCWPRKYKEFCYILY